MPVVGGVNDDARGTMRSAEATAPTVVPASLQLRRWYCERRGRGRRATRNQPGVLKQCYTPLFKHSEFIDNDMRTRPNSRLPAFVLAALCRMHRNSCGGEIKAKAPAPGIGLENRKSSLRLISRPMPSSRPRNLIDITDKGTVRHTASRVYGGGLHYGMHIRGNVTLGWNLTDDRQLDKKADCEMTQ